MALTSLVVMPMRGPARAARGLPVSVGAAGRCTGGLSRVVSEFSAGPGGGRASMRGSSRVVGELPAGLGADTCTSVRTQILESDSDGQGKFRYRTFPFSAHLKMVSAEAGGAASSMDKRTHADFDTAEAFSLFSVTVRSLASVIFRRTHPLSSPSPSVP